VNRWRRHLGYIGRMRALITFLGWDLRIARAIHQFPIPAALTSIFRFYTRIGDGWIWAIWAIVVFSVLPIEAAALAAREACLAAACSIPLYKVVKGWIRRPRPYRRLRHEVAQIDPLDEFSFPSGHTMNNMAVALALGSHIPEAGMVGAGMALSWGLLRVHFGVHYLTDVLGGVALAILCAWVAHQIHNVLSLVLPAI
jgi:undecaprenyl-diphosphatase